MRDIGHNPWVITTVASFFSTPVFGGHFSQLFGCRWIAGGMHRGHGEQRGRRIPPELEVSGARLLQVRHFHAMARLTNLAKPY